MVGQFSKSNSFTCLLLVHIVWAIVNVIGKDDVLRIELREGVEAGYTVLDVGNLFSFHDTIIDKQITFSTTPASLEPSLSLLKQKIVIFKPIYHESFCGPSIHCDLYINIKYTNSSGYEEVVKVKLKLLDSKNNVPTFPKSLIQKALPENTKVGLKISLPLATDSDIGENSMISYSLDPRNIPFKLSEKKDSEGKVVVLAMELIRSLRGEFHKILDFQVVATDHGQPRLSSALQISIDILNEDDNRPRFHKDLYEGQVRTDDYVGKVIVEVVASDPNSDENGKVRYSFPLKTQTLYGDMFEINEESGTITLKAPLTSKAHLEPQIKFLVMADLGVNLIPPSTTVQIDIIKANTHQPRINIDSPYMGSDPENLITEENNSENFQLAKVLVADEDMGEAGMVDCRVNSQVFELIRSNEEEFLLIVKHVLDHESQGFYKIDISCRDFGDPPLSNDLKLNIIVTDLDDNPPVFTKSTYIVRIVENNLIGTNILKLDVTDRDSEAHNKKVTFSIEPHFEHLFSIVQSSGIVYTLARFDRELVDQYSFHVFAKSGGSTIDLHTHNSSSFDHITKTLVNVTIVDVDDEIAKFTQPWFKFEVEENQPPGTVVGKVVAVDADLPPNNRFTYSLTPPDSENHYIEQNQKNSNTRKLTLPFYIEAFTGEIKTTTSLDREIKSKYDFKVYAGRESTTVYVDVSDVNDNPPVFDTSLRNSCLKPESIRIQGNLTISRQLSKVSASDIDEISDISYSIIAGNDFNQFGIDEKTGEIFWNSYLSVLSNSQGCRAQLKLRVHDSLHYSETACLELVFEECLTHLLEQQRRQEELSKKQNAAMLSPFTDLYFLIIVVVLVCCVATVVILTSAICITRHKTKRLKEKSRMMMLQDHDNKSNLQLSRSETDTLLVLNRSHDNESSDQLTGILVSIKSVEQLHRLQLRSLAPSRDSLMSTSTCVCKERDGDSGYADVASPV